MAVKKEKRVRYWPNIHDNEVTHTGSVIDEDETHYFVVPDDDVQAEVMWLKSKCAFIE